MPSSARYGTSAVTSLKVRPLLSCSRYVARGMTARRVPAAVMPGAHGAGSFIRSHTLEQPRHAPWLEAVALDGSANIRVRGVYDASRWQYENWYGVIAQIRDEVKPGALTHSPVHCKC